jgi:hypothetical protein
VPSPAASRAPSARDSEPSVAGVAEAAAAVEAVVVEAVVVEAAEGEAAEGEAAEGEAVEGEAVVEEEEEEEAAAEAEAVAVAPRGRRPRHSEASQDTKREHRLQPARRRFGAVQLLPAVRELCPCWLSP